MTSAEQRNADATVREFESQLEQTINDGLKAGVPPERAMRLLASHAMQVAFHCCIHGDQATDIIDEGVADALDLRFATRNANATVET